MSERPKQTAKLEVNISYVAVPDNQGRGLKTALSIFIPEENTSNETQA